MAGLLNESNLDTSVVPVARWETKTEDFNALEAKGYRVDTTSTTINMTLPETPTLDDKIFFMDLKSNFDTNALTILRNGKKINGIADDLLVNVKNYSGHLIFTGDTDGWILM